MDKRVTFGINVCYYYTDVEDKRNTWLMDCKHFQKRIKQMEKVLNPILDTNHRKQIHKKRMKILENESIGNGLCCTH